MRMLPDVATGILAQAGKQPETHLDTCDHPGCHYQSGLDAQAQFKCMITACTQTAHTFARPETVSLEGALVTDSEAEA